MLVNSLLTHPRGALNFSLIKQQIHVEIIEINKIHLAVKKIPLVTICLALIKNILSQDLSSAKPEETMQAKRKATRTTPVLKTSSSSANFQL